MTAADLGAAAVAGVLALVPTAIVLLALQALAQRLDLPARFGSASWRLISVVLGSVLATGIVVGTWAAAGANYLKPRCLAFGTPEYAMAGDAAAPPVLTDGIGIDAGAPPPAWVSTLLVPGGFRFIEWREPGGRVVRQPGDATGLTRVQLRVRRSTRRVSAWLSLGSDRFTLVDRLTGNRLATADELWVDAGLARYRCGVLSGPEPARRGAVDAARLLGFVRGAVRPAPRS